MRIKFIIIVALQVVLLLGLIAYKQHWVAAGERIILKTMPVDPRDIFRGDYVQLGYEITNLDLDKLSVNESFGHNDRIYVVLEKDADGTYKAVSVGKLQPVGKKFIQGRVAGSVPSSSRWEVSVKDDAGDIRKLTPRWFSGIKKGDRVAFCLDRMDNILHFSREGDSYRPKCDTGNSVTGIIEDIKEIKFRHLNVEYGIESYFVEEGKGKAIEKARNARELKVEVSLRDDGKGIITRLMMDGKEFK